MQKNYSENPAYYKGLIAKINTEVNFPAYLHHLGYKLIKKSAGSLEFQNGDDRIVLNIGRNPVTYFNRNDSTDKGLFFKFIRRHHANFYKTVKSGLEIIDRAYEGGETPFEVSRKEASSKTLEENYHIAPLQKVDYLVQNRGIYQSMLNDGLFKGRIFNAFHIRDNGGKIGNIAFPKYDLEGNPKNYILYNKEYFDRRENRRKKFRLTLNKRDHFLFYSKPISSPKRVIFGESAIDLLSYHELHGTSQNFYVSFGGSVYPEKLSFFIQLIEPMLGQKKAEVISIMDNDLKGHEFDLKVFSALINHGNPNVYVETVFQKGKVCINVHYREQARNEIAKHKNILEEKMTYDLWTCDLGFRLVRCTGFSDKMVLEFYLKELVDTHYPNTKTSILGTLVKNINSLYLPTATDVHKSNGKDWNDDLRESKKTKYVEMSKIQVKTMGIGDKIELKSELGPEGAKNEGIVVALKNNGVSCDFGLKHTYVIPLKAIKTHYQKISNTPMAKLKGNRKKFNKNRTLSIS